MAFLTSGLGRWLAVGLVILLLGGVVMLQRAQLRAAGLERDQAVARADAADARYGALTEDLERVDAAAGRAEAARTRLEVDLAAARRTIADAPTSTACIDSAPVRAALGWLSGRAPTPADLPARRAAPLVPDVVPQLAGD